MDGSSIMGARQDEPLVTTRQVLECIPGLQFEALSKRIKLKMLILPERTAPGSGRKRLYTPSDVVHVAMFDELLRYGVSARAAHLFWLLHMKGRVVARRFPMPDDPPNMSAFVVVQPGTGDVDVHKFRETGEGAEKLDDPDAPDTLVVLRMDRIIDRIAARLAVVLADLPAQPTADLAQPDFAATTRVKDPTT